MTKFQIMGNRMKGPAELPGAHIRGVDIWRRRRQRLGIASSHDDQVLVDNARAGQRNRLLLRVASKISAQIDSPIFAKGRNWLTRSGVQRVKEVHYARQNPLIFPAGPISQTAVWLRAVDPRIEFPK